MYTESLLIPINLLIPNTGAPTFKGAISDVTVKVNEIGTIKFPAISDPEKEDLYSLLSADFGSASKFVSGNFPDYKISPTNN